MDLVILAGPVQRSNLDGVQWGDRVPHIELYNTGPGGGYASSDFAALASQMQGPDGRILPTLLASRGLDRGQFEKVALVGFSAAHGLFAPLLAADGDQIDAAICLDACFGAAGAPRKDGYVSFGRRAAFGSKLMVMTASAGQNAPPLPPSTTGYECVLANATEAAGPLLHAFTPPEGVPPTTQGQSLRAGDLIVLDYRGEYQHGDHINRFGPQIVQAFLVPYLNESGALANAAALLVGMAAGFAAMRYVTTGSVI